MLSRICFVPLLLAATATANNDSCLQALFGHALSSGAEIFYPSWANWTTDVQQRWTSYLAPSYLGAIKVATTSDVQNIVKIAAEHNITFLATGGGHGTSAIYAGLRNGIDIDLSNLRYATLDSTGNYVTIGGATPFREVWDALYVAGKEIPTGTSECVGALGASLGAGVGPLQGKHGLMLDSLVSVKLVTAQGELVNVSKTENADLFWGIRGAGWNFGIVTEATYQVYNTSNNGQVLEGDMLFPVSANGSIWEALKTFDTTLPDSLSFSTALSYSATTKETSIIVNVIYFGSEEDVQQYLEPFYAIGPTFSNFTEVPWNQLYKALFFGSDGSSCETNLHLQSGTAGVGHIDVTTFTNYTDTFADYWPQYPDVDASVVIFRYPNNAAVAVPDEETAYAYRNISAHVFWEFTYPDNATLDQATYDFLVESRNTFAATSGYDHLALYHNFGHGDEGPEVWYTAEKLPRLTALKQEWDPEQRFSWYNPVPIE